MSGDGGGDERYSTAAQRAGRFHFTRADEPWLCLGAPLFDHLRHSLANMASWLVPGLHAEIGTMRDDLVERGVHPCRE